MRHLRRSIASDKTHVTAVENDEFSLTRMVTRFGLVTIVVRKNNVKPFKEGMTKIEFFYRGQLYAHVYDYAMSARAARGQAKQMAEDVAEGRWLQ